MRLSIFTASVVLTCLLSGPVWAQSSATLDISDVDLFYRLYDATDGRPTAEQIQSGYIDVGSPGLRTFFDARRTTAVRVAEAMVSRPEIYRQARECSSVLPQVKGQVDAALAKLVGLYPEARLPSVTLAVAAAPSPSAVRSRAYRSGWKPCVQRTSLSLISRAVSWASWCTNMFMPSRTRV